MNSTVEALIEYALSEKRTERIVDIRIGLGYTGVKLESGKCGVACLLRHRLGSGTCSLLSQAGTMSGSDVSQIVPLARSQSVVESAVGLATVNALAAQDEYEVTPSQDLSELLRITQEDQVGMVGYIAPVVRDLRRQAKEVFVFDEAKVGMSDVCEVSQEAQLLPHCDVVILSATSLLNHTFDTLLEMSSQAREICVMGPSTPLIPEIFRDRGITLLAGRQIVDTDKLLQIVSEAGGTKKFSRVTKKIYLSLKTGK